MHESIATLILVKTCPMHCFLKFSSLALLVFFISCKKQEQRVTYEMIFKKNESVETFSPYYCSVKPKAAMPGKTKFTLIGRSKDYKNEFAITIMVTGNFNTGTYQTGNPDWDIIADYFKDIGSPNERDFTIDNAPGQPNGQFTVTITAVTDKLVKGNFSGNYLYDTNYDESIVITDGSFTAKRNQ